MKANSRTGSAKHGRVAIYARYSMEDQREESIEDQITACRRLCESKGWTVAAVYSDAAMTGSSKHRPGYQRFCEDMRKGDFDMVVVESLDRLSRLQSETAALFDRIIFHGIKLITLDRGELSAFLAGILATMGQANIEDLRHKTKRGLSGKIDKVLSAGGLGYGYAVDAKETGARNIIEDEAVVIRRIFDLYANGASPRAIVSMLNKEGVPGPVGRPWVDTTVRGQIDRGTGILNNAAYVGRLEWNRCSYVRSPDTGKRLARPNPREEWRVMDAPHLRIIDDELWNRAKLRQQIVRTVMGRDDSGQALNRAHRAVHLLSGLIYCGDCGAPFAMRDAKHYGCRNHRSKGTCDNSLLVDRYDLERVVAEAVKTQWLTVVNIKSLCARLQARHDEDVAGSGDARASLEAKAVRVAAQTGRLVSAIADAGHSAPLIAKLATLESEAKRLRAEIEDLDDAVAPLVLSTVEVESMIENFASNLESLFDATDRASVALREKLRGMIERIVVTPREGQDPLFTVEGDFVGVMQAAGLLGDWEPKTQTAPEAGASGAVLSVVAGAGFEPAAFRL